MIDALDTTSDATTDAGTGTGATPAAPAPAPATGTTPAAKTTTPAAATKTIATGADSEADDEDTDAPVGDGDKGAAKDFWPPNWREKAAEHYAAGDQKIYKKELARLQRIADPVGMYGMYRELEGKFTGGGLLKVPGKDAKPEEIAQFHKALGVPETPDAYFKDMKLENGAVIGEADKPLVSAFATDLHKAGATPQVMNAALNWYYKQQEEIAAEQDEADDTFRRESERALKDELGPAFKRTTNAIATLFASAPGGTDVSNEGGLFARLMAGRMADGKMIGNDPDMVKFLSSLATEINPAATLVEDGNQSGVSLDDEIRSIEKDMRENRREYFRDEKKQARYRTLLETRDKIQSRQRA